MKSLILLFVLLLLSILIGLLFVWQRRRGENNYYNQQTIITDTSTTTTTTTTTINPTSLSSLQQDDDNDKKILHFRNDIDNNKVFRVIQFTDLHLGEDPFTDWGPRADKKTIELLPKLIEAEQKEGNNIDLIIFSGDQITGNNVDKNATTYYNMLSELIEEKIKIPYAIIFGNHDDMDFHQKYNNGTIINHPVYTSRKQLIQYDIKQQHSNMYSYSQQGPDNIPGVSNYVLNVYNNDENNNDNNNIALQIILLDSGGGSINETITQEHIDWYMSQRILDIDGILFQHIPTKEFQYNTTSNNCIGMDGEHNIAPLEYDPINQINFLQQYDRKLHIIAVGHNHGNSYCCHSNNNNNNHTNLHLCFGRHSGYGGYGGIWEKGARIYEFILDEEENDNSSILSWKTWVRLESFNITDEYLPKKTTKKEEEEDIDDVDIILPTKHWRRQPLPP